jgi:excinuclease ABC subunit A
MVQPAGRPDVDAVLGIPPTVAIEQRQSRGGQKSTVATMTEVWHFLRLLWVKLGIQHCVHDDTPVQAQSEHSIAAQLLHAYRGQHVGVLAPLVIQRKGVYNDLAKWAKARGHTHLRVNGEFVPTEPWPALDRYHEHTIELPVADVVLQPENEATLRQFIQQTVQLGKGVVHVLAPLDGLAHAMEQGLSTQGIGRISVFSTERACPTCGTSYAEPDPRWFSFNSAQGWCGHCCGTGLALTKAQREAYIEQPFHGDQQQEKTFVHPEPDWEGMEQSPCPECQGTRLNPAARAVRLQHQSITQVAQWSVAQAKDWIMQLNLQGRQADIGRDVVSEIQHRLAFLEEVGLGYLTLDRAAPTLSGGEAQRIRLAAQLGSHLQGVCYVLDEPTIGLHPRDNQILLGALKRLGERGNTLVVVEHDEETIRHADHIIDIGPGAGSRGGRVVAQGTVAQISAVPDSLTGQCLAHPLQHPMRPRRNVETTEPALQVRSAHKHNLRNVDAAIPLHRLVCLTGVSGSGKSTLARDVLLRNVQNALAHKAHKGHDGSGGLLWQGCSGLEGWNLIDRVLEVDQTPIGKTPRSCAATYIGFWDAIRQLFAQTLEAKARGYTAARFSFNTGQGRCPACEGQGMRTLEMSFLPDVKMLCDQCHGQRFNTETLAVTWHGQSIGSVLNMPVDEALPFFAAMPAIAKPLQLLQDVGLGYLTLGQPSPTLSGGEAQRIKLVAELSKVRDDITRRGQKAQHTLYVLDEPTVGLHMADVSKLLHVLHRLVDAGHSVMVIEHDLDVMAESDWILDMGPEGGDGGGLLVAQGTPEAIVAAQTATGIALQRVLNQRN